MCDETVIAYVKEAKSSTMVFRESIKIISGLLVFIPFLFYLATSEKGLFETLFGWIATSLFFFVGGYIALYFDQKVIKKRLTKIIMSKYT